MAKLNGIDWIMLDLQDFRNKRLSAVLAQWLVALFFLQTLMPIQAHSQIATNDQGTPVVICTLDGDKSVYIDFDAHDHTNVAPSAAMLFSDLINDFAPARQVVRPPVAVMDRIVIAQDVVSHVASRSQVDTSSRAPPRL